MKSASTISGAPSCFKTLPFPDELRTVLQEKLQSIPEYHAILGCAACLGGKFNISVLAESLDIRKLELISILDRIEREVGMIQDIRDDDDYYSFNSSFMLEVIRESLSISGHGPESADVPQLVREYHVRVASSLEKSLKSNPGAVFEIARHYYAAGTTQAEKALQYCIQAAHTANSTFNYNQARSYVEKAAECAKNVGIELDVEKEFLLINCFESHVEGHNRVKAAADSLSYLDNHPDALVGVIRVITRACYNAGVDTGDQCYFARAVELGQTIVDRAQDSLQKSIGYHFVGIALPREQKEERERCLRKAYELLDDYPNDDLSAMALKARVGNSLAEQLSYGTAKDKKEAADLFAISIKIKERPELYDKPGIARSHGGLGRLAFFRNPPDLTVARKEFEKDLKLSEDIGDISGQSKMYNFLGNCDFIDGNRAEDAGKKEENFKNALNYYRLAFEVGEEAIDRLFAGADLLKCIWTISEPLEDIDTIGETLLKVAKQALENESSIPIPCAVSIYEAFELCGDRKTKLWFSELKKIVGNTLKR